MNDKEFTKYIANRPSAKESDGAWKRFVESNKLAEKETPKQTWERLEKEQQHPQDKYFDDKMKEIDKKGTSYLAKHLKKDPPIMERRGQQTLALREIGKKVLDQGNLKPEDIELKLNENGLHTNKDRTIAVRDSFVANAFNKSLGIKPKYPTEATPEQFGALAKRLERDRQMRGEPTNVQKFEKNFNNINTKKPIIKKPFKRSGPVEPIKLDLNNYRPFTPLEPIVKDPQMIEAERRYENVKNEIKEERYKNAHSGIASIVGGDPKYCK